MAFEKQTNKNTTQTNKQNKTKKQKQNKTKQQQQQQQQKQNKKQVGTPWGLCTPNQKLALFCMLSQNYQSFFFLSFFFFFFFFLQNSVYILKQMIQGIQKWHWNFRSPTGFSVINQNSQNIVLINNLRFECYFWVPWTIYYKMHILFFFKKGVENF